MLVTDVNAPRRGCAEPVETRRAGHAWLRLQAASWGRGLRDRGGAGAGLPRYPPPAIRSCMGEQRCDVCRVKSCPCVSREDFPGDTRQLVRPPPGGLWPSRRETWRWIWGERRSCRCFRKRSTPEVHPWLWGSEMLRGQAEDAGPPPNPRQLRG